MKKIFLILSISMALTAYTKAQSCIIISEPPAVNAGMASNPTQCQGNNTIIDLNTQLTGADNGGSWTISASSANDPGSQFNTSTGELSLSGLSTGSYSLTYTVGTATCNDTETVQVTIQDCCPPKVCSSVKVTKI